MQRRATEQSKLTAVCSTTSAGKSRVWDRWHEEAVQAVNPNPQKKP